MEQIEELDRQSESLQADVMRFLAITAFALLVVFIPLIQAISERPSTSKSTSAKRNVEAKISSHEAPANQIQKRVIQPKLLEKPALTTTPKTQQRRISIQFDDGAFEYLLEKHKIGGYVVIPEPINLCFQFQLRGNSYRFENGVPELPLHSLREATLPRSLVRSFETTYPDLATQKREFYFHPSDKIERSLQEIRIKKLYGIFRIMRNEEVVKIGR